MKYWIERSDIPCKDLLKWAKLPTSKYHTWLKRYGKINEHNGKIPRDWWLEDWEKQAILDFHDKHTLEGYRRLTFMMLDDDIVAVSPSSTYRVLKTAGRLGRKIVTPSKKGTGYIQPTKIHQEWHLDVSYINVGGTFCLAGLSEVIGEERDRKLEAARKQRQEKRAAAKQVA